MLKKVIHVHGFHDVVLGRPDCTWGSMQDQDTPMTTRSQGLRQSHI